MDTHIYDTYEKEFKTLFEQIQKDIQNLKITSSFIAHLDDKKLIQNKITREIEEAEEIAR